jgi:ATP-dependent NAD(P)H-hydrate dehydratase
MSALRTGSDLVHVFCEDSAAIPIKSYSPDLIVHGYIGKGIPESVDRIKPWLNRLHCLVIGPGAGRSATMFSVIEAIIGEAKLLKLSLVIDAVSQP